MKFLYALMLAGVSAQAFGATMTLPATAGIAVQEQAISTSYGCARDGAYLYADTAHGFGRCKAVFPLTLKEGEGLVQARVGHFSPDKKSWIDAVVWKQDDSSMESVGSAYDFSQSANVSELLDIPSPAAVVGDTAMVLIVEVRGDTMISTVSYDYLEPSQ